MAHLKFEIDEQTIKRILVSYIQSKLGDVKVDENDVKIEVKSKQNYRSEWETSAFRAQYSAIIND